jgi:hypothetical protein
MRNVTTLERDPVVGTVAVTALGVTLAVAIAATFTVSVLLFIEPKVHILGSLLMD